MLLLQHQLAHLLLVVVYPVALTTEANFNEHQQQQQQHQQHQQPLGEEEYCERETFEASCSSDEVIIVRSAIFGRMNIGRCVENGYGFLGCSVTALPEVENRCSGRRSCQFPVGSLHVKRPCPSELISFLKVNYDCVKVTSCPEFSCSSGKALKVTASEGYLASSVTSSSGCGSDSCPWVFEALPGQRFNLTFQSFMRISTESQQQQQHHQQLQQQQMGGRYCQRLATVVESPSQVSKDVTLCDSDVTVVRMMTSSHDEVKLKLYHGTPESPAHFIVHYQVVGCPDPDLPVGAWMRRSGDSSVTVGCHGRPTMWHMTCNGNTWIGDTGECVDASSHDANPNWSVQEAMERAGATAEGILVVIGLGIIIGVVVGCLLLSVVVVIIKRRRHKMALQYERRLELLAHYSPGVAASCDQADKFVDPKSAAAAVDFQPANRSLMIYDSGFGGTYDEAHSYTSPLPEGVTCNFGPHQNGGKNIAETTNCVMHGDHVYESHDVSSGR